MRMLWLAALGASGLGAQNFARQIKMKPLLPPLSQPWTKPAQPSKLTVKKPASSGQCAIPLANVTPRKVDPQMLVAPPEPSDHMPEVTPPAPPCEKPVK